MEPLDDLALLAEPIVIQPIELSVCDQVDEGTDAYGNGNLVKMKSEMETGMGDANSVALEHARAEHIAGLLEVEFLIFLISLLN